MSQIRANTSRVSSHLKTNSLALAESKQTQTIQVLRDLTDTEWMKLGVLMNFSLTFLTTLIEAVSEGKLNGAWFDINLSTREKLVNLVMEQSTWANRTYWDRTKVITGVKFTINQDENPAFRLTNKYHPYWEQLAEEQRTLTEGEWSIEFHD
mgnify:CR=1 FL=1